ncbi:MAG: hypothetical protein V4657_04245 [Pseudomonadota bacterium]
MTHVLSVKSFTKTTLVAALLSGSCLAAAQEVPVVTPAPEPAPQAEVQQPAPSATVNPPPVVPTLPTENDVVNPAAQKEAAEEAQAKAAPAPVARNRAQVPARPQTQPQPQPQAAAVQRDTGTGGGSGTSTSPFNEPALSSALPPSNGANEIAVVPPPASQVQDRSSPAASGENDLPLFAGIAAALAALGLGGLFMARRRRIPAKASHRIERTHVAQSPVAPDTTVAPAPIQSPVVPQAPSERPKGRESLNTRPDIPVTDPLFNRPVAAGPITDPMFAPRNDVQTPITDPLFAKHDGFAGRFRDIKPTPTPETV